MKYQIIEEVVFYQDCYIEKCAVFFCFIRVTLWYNLTNNCRYFCIQLLLNKGLLFGTIISTNQTKHKTYDEIPTRSSGCTLIIE